MFISGYDIFSGSKDYGPFAKLGQLSKKNGKIFKIYSYGYPLVSVSGVDNIKSLLKNEFKDDSIGTFMFVPKFNNLIINFGELIPFLNLVEYLSIIPNSGG